MFDYKEIERTIKDNHLQFHKIEAVIKIKATITKITCFMYFFKLSPCTFILKKTLKYSKVF